MPAPWVLHHKEIFCDEKMKVMTVVGTRPEIIRLACVMVALDKYCDHVLVHTGQNYDYELNQIFLITDCP